MKAWLKIGIDPETGQKISLTALVFFVTLLLAGAAIYETGWIPAGHGSHL